MLLENSAVLTFNGILTISKGVAVNDKNALTFPALETFKSFPLTFGKRCS